MSSILKDYIEQKPEVLDLLRTNIQNPSIRKATIERAQSKRLSPVVRATIEEQNAELGSSESLEKLKTPEISFVVTGQQVGLFLGPLFTFYKAATAIVNARALEKEFGTPVIPLFWLQNEDHDYDEIKACNLFDTEPEQSHLSLNGNTDKVSVKYKNTGDNASALVDKIDSLYAELPEKDWAVSILREAYQNNRSLGDAFAEALLKVFGDSGLLVLDANTPSIKKLAEPIYSSTLKNFAEINEILNLQSERIETHGYETQVFVRENSPLFFVHERSPDGPRHRVVKDDSGWYLLGNNNVRFTDSEIEELVKSNTERVSSSALLRPLIQDSILPTVAYVGGPAEISYSAQNAPLYELLDTPKPLIIPRAQFLILEQRAARVMEKLGLDMEDLQLPECELIRKVVEQTDEDSLDPADLLEKAKAQISWVFVELAERVTELDKTLLKNVKKTHEKTVSNIDNLEQKLLKAIARNNELLSDRLERLLAWLFPEGSVQERHYSSIFFLCKYGKEFNKRVLEEIEPYSFTNKELDL